MPAPLAALGGVHIVQVSAGEYHVGCVSREGRLFLWGKSEAGCCGDLNAATHKLLEPFELRLAPAVAETSQMLQQQPLAVLVDHRGHRSTLAQLKDGSVSTWGCGAGGRLGHGDSFDRHTPTLVKALAGHHIAAASMGSCHTTMRPKARRSDLDMGKIHAPSSTSSSCLAEGCGTLTASGATHHSRWYGVTVLTHLLPLLLFPPLVPLGHHVIW